MDSFSSLLSIERTDFSSRRGSHRQQHRRSSTLFEVTGTKLNSDVDEIHGVGDIVHDLPYVGVITLQWIERLSSDGKPKIVEHEDVQ